MTVENIPVTLEGSVVYSSIPNGYADGVTLGKNRATRMLREYRIDIRTVQLIGGWRSLDQMAEYLGVGSDAITNSARPRRDVLKH